MFYAVQENSGAKISQLLLDHPDLVNCELINGLTNPICRSATLGNNNIILLLLKHGADINLRSSDGRTPLMWASIHGKLSTIDLLLENGADKDLTDQEGLNCFDHCVIKCHYMAAKFLYDKHGMTRNADERELLYR